MVVCHCEQVNSRTVDRVIAAGATDLDAVRDACRAGADCGGCHGTIEELLARCEFLLEAASADDQRVA